MKKRKEETKKDCARCLYNNQVECEELTRVCKNCGWHPEVSEKRRKELREQEEAQP